MHRTCLIVIAALGAWSCNSDSPASESGDEDSTAGSAQHETGGSEDESAGPGGPTTTHPEDVACVQMQGDGPCLVETLIDVPSLNLVFGDFDGDGFLDIAAERPGADTSQADDIQLLSGSATGFAAPTTLSFDPTPQHDGSAVSLGLLRVRRVEGGADQIFAQGTYGSFGSIAIDNWWSDGATMRRVFAPTSSPPAGPWFGDFDGNGTPELVYASAGSSLDPLEAFECGAGSCSSLGTRSVTAAPPPPWTVLSGELTGDARDDLVVVTRTNDAGTFQSQAWVLQSTGSAFSGAQPVALGSSLSAFAISLADIDADGTLDLLVVADGGHATADDDAAELHVFAGNGSGGFSLSQVVDVGGNITAVAVSDFDGDGNPDLIVRRNDEAAIWVLLGGGPLGLESSLAYELGASSTGLQGKTIPRWPTTVYDLDADGRPEILTVVQTASGYAVSVLRITE